MRILARMDREALPLLLAADEFAPHRELEPLDRIRVQKGTFLLQKAGPRDWHDLFDFQPWDWGPFSKELALVVNDLIDRGLLLPESVPSRPHSRYRTSSMGAARVLEVSRGLSEQEIDFIRRVRAYVTSRSFSQLLREVYRAYPEYATKSRFQG